MTLYIPTGWIGEVIEGMTTNITGSLYLTYFFIFIVLAFMFLLLFKVPLEWTIIGFTGMFLTLLAYSSEWLVFFGVLAFFLAVLIARNWITD